MSVAPGLRSFLTPPVLRVYGRWAFYLAALLALLAFLAFRGTQLPTGTVRNEVFEYDGVEYRRTMVAERLPNGTYRSVLTDTYADGKTGTVTVVQPELPRDNNLRRMWYKVAHALQIPVARRMSSPVVVVRRPIPQGANWEVTLQQEGRNGFRIAQLGEKPIGASLAASDFMTPFERRWMCGFDTVWYPDAE